jgi:outer membrane biosynthesis protein TonB
MKRLSVTRWLPILLLAAMLVMFPLQSARADIGPKPTMSFSFTYEIDLTPEISSGSLLECINTNCTEAVPLQKMGPQHFDCSDSSCSSMA